MFQPSLVGRDFFDTLAKVDIPEFKLQIWPGYKTTINQYEDNLLMVTEITQGVAFGYNFANDQRIRRNQRI